MSTRAVHIVVDAADPSRLASFWADALGWVVASDEPDEAVVWPPGFGYPGTTALPLVFVPVLERKHGKNRIHLDLATTSAEHQAATVDRLIGLGAVRADVGQAQVPWDVLADPEGNEFCVLEPRAVYLDTGPVAAVVADSANPPAAAGFWAAATGWMPHETDPDFASLREPGKAGPYLEFLRVPDAKIGKNRLHVDVAPPADGPPRSARDELGAPGIRAWGAHTTAGVRVGASAAKFSTMCPTARSRPP